MSGTPAARTVKRLTDNRALAEREISTTMIIDLHGQTHQENTYQQGHTVIEASIKNMLTHSII